MGTATKGAYKALYDGWKSNPLAFWGEEAKAIDWYTAPKTTFDPASGVYGRWFPDGVVNTAYNCLDRHVAAGRGAQAALIAYGDNETGTRFRWTEVQKDHENSVAIGTHAIMGVKKATYKSKDGNVQRDFGVMALDTANTDPNA